MAAGVHMESEGYVMTDLHFPLPIYAAQSTLKLRPHRIFSQPSTLMLMIKAKDSLSGRITDNGGVRKSLGKDDISKLSKGFERTKDIMKNAGARGIYSGWELAAHPGGTVKIGHLVNSDLKTEHENLFVCDCSVIPEAFGLPPTLTLLGLGKRLAKHLTDSKSKGESA